MKNRVREWATYQLDTYRTARAYGMTYWQLRRVRRAVRAWVRANTMPFEEWK